VPAWSRAWSTVCEDCTPVRTAHMREDTILSLETTARYRPENPYQPAKQWGWRQAPSSAILSTGDSLSANSAGAADCSWSWDCTLDFTEQLRPHRQRLTQRFDWCESVARKMASARWPSPLDITSVARQPMYCCRSEVLIVLQAKTLSGNTAIRRQNVNVINWEIPSQAPACCLSLAERGARSSPPAQEFA
jgi:hypothetical protein